MKSLSLVFSLRLLQALGSALGVFLLLLQVHVLVDFVADQACGKNKSLNEKAITFFRFDNGSDSDY